MDLFALIDVPGHSFDGLEVFVCGEVFGYFWHECAFFEGIYGVGFFLLLDFSFFVLRPDFQSLDGGAGVGFLAGV